MIKHWAPIVSIWLLVAGVAIFASLAIDAQDRFPIFGMLAAGSLALVSLQHLVVARPNETVRQMVYVATGSLGIIVIATAFALLV
ncbi:MAG: hypothetical protein RI590_03065 [Microbacteriaceae bacterium]|nr:hypothetical protein [Microbacteriaceae bacterium]MDR9444230.1 hypothetical protein [Microbacteriaceae bacterium]